MQNHTYTPYFWIQELVKNNEIFVPYVNTKTNISDIHVHTKSVTTDVIKTLVRKACGYEAEWLHELMINTTNAATPINPKHKHRVISSHCRAATEGSDCIYSEVDDNGECLDIRIA